MDQGFWLFFIFQVIALGAMADRMNLVGMRKQALVAGLAASTGAALFTLLLNYGVVSSDFARMLLKWFVLAAIMGSLLATAASVALPAELSRRKA
jgi:hypothetical protein